MPEHVDLPGPVDALGSDGLLEIKCPASHTHIATLLGAPIDPDYLIQMQWQMACTGRAWCDFVSFDPRLPGEMQIWVKRVERDGAFIAEMEREIEAFLDELTDKMTALRSRYQEAA